MVSTVSTPGPGASTGSASVHRSKTRWFQLLAEDSAGNLWIGTAADGLYRWKAEDIAADIRRFDQFTERHGLPSSTIYSGEFDQRGNLWLGTGNGISRLNPTSLEFENYDTSHGLLAAEFTFGAVLRSREGRLYFGSDAGFNAFFPDEIRGNPHPPKLAITGINKLNEPLAIAPLLSGAALLELTHKDYLLEFEVAGLDFAAPERNRYRFRLDGLDEDWLDVGEKRSITYTNLAPGEYVFRARAANNYGVWSSQEATLTFRVLPAPWATWWAYLIYAAALLGSGAIVYRTRAAQVREKAAARHADELSSINTELSREVSARREKETELKREKRRAETYFNVAEVVLLTLDRSMRIARLNDKGVKLLGRDESEVIGRPWSEFIPERHQDAARDHLDAILQQPTAAVSSEIELPLLDDGGQERQFVWRCAVVEFSNEDPALFLSGMDVTRMRALEKQMRLREKMNAIGTLAGGIAHDFNNILQAIYGFTTLALDNLPPADEKAAYLRQVVKGADRARNLVKRILDLQQPEGVRPSRRRRRPRCQRGLRPAARVDSGDGRDQCRCRRRARLRPRRSHPYSPDCHESRHERGAGHGGNRRNADRSGAGREHPRVPSSWPRQITGRATTRSCVYAIPAPV